MKITGPAMQLARLSKVGLREVFTTEAGDFTPWLAKEENLSLLGDTIGLSLELEGQEKEVGPFRADILCKDAATENWVLIENQIERTDHTHLGQLITYAAGLQAVTIVWIAERFTDEHRAALDWLNEKTDEHINLFGLEIELWRIGDSPVAPKFNVISQPNDWSRTVQAAAQQSAASTEHSQLQLRFFTAFRDYMLKEKSPIRCTKPYPQCWMYHPIRKSGLKLASAATLWNPFTTIKQPEIRVDLEITGAHAKAYFAEFERHKSEIEDTCGSLVWYNPPTKGTSRIYVQKAADFRTEELWQEQFKWLKENLELFQRGFQPIIEKINIDESESLAVQA